MAKSKDGWLREKKAGSMDIVAIMKSQKCNFRSEQQHPPEQHSAPQPLQSSRGQGRSVRLQVCPNLIVLYTDRKENKIFFIYKEIQKGAVAKSYKTNGLLIYD